VLLHHTVTGSGPAVLLLHAGVCDSRMWEPQVEALAADHAVVTADFRGYGESPLPPGSYSDAGDVLELLDHLGIEDVRVVGASYGGGVALQLASTVPQRVTRLVLLSAAADGVEPTADLRAFAQQENALLEAGDIAGATELNVRTWVGPEAGDAVRERVRAMQELAFRVQLSAGDDVHATELPVELATISAPALVTAGGHDLDFFRVLARHLAAEIPHARHLVLGWAGHLPSLERPGETSALIREAINA
jgi:pimeloyl-ACP methyl ester carboxylesterase